MRDNGQQFQNRSLSQQMQMPQLNLTSIPVFNYQNPPSDPKSAYQPPTLPNKPGESGQGAQTMNFINIQNQFFFNQQNLMLNMMHMKNPFNPFGQSEPKAQGNQRSQDMGQGGSQGEKKWVGGEKDKVIVIDESDEEEGGKKTDGLDQASQKYINDKLKKIRDAILNKQRTTNDSKTIRKKHLLIYCKQCRKKTYQETSSRYCQKCENTFKKNQKYGISSFEKRSMREREQKKVEKEVNYMQKNIDNECDFRMKVGSKHQASIPSLAPKSFSFLYGHIKTNFLTPQQVIQEFNTKKQPEKPFIQQEPDSDLEFELLQIRPKRSYRVHQLNQKFKD